MMLEILVIILWQIFFHFTVDTDTATIGGVKGGGVGCSVGPVTLSS